MVERVDATVASNDVRGAPRHAVLRDVVSNVAVHALRQALHRVACEEELRRSSLFGSEAAVGKIDRALEFRDLPHRQVARGYQVLPEVGSFSFTFDRQRLELLNTFLSAQGICRI